MFRYFGFHWRPEAPTQAAIAQRLDESIHRADGWQLALSSRGLRVYTVGCRPGVNGTYSLPLGQGVIVGRLFRRGDEPNKAGDISLSENEGNRILRSDGRALIDDYWGRYIAVLRSDRHTTRLLRDPSGALPCYRSSIEGMDVFFSWLEDMIAFMPGVPTPRVDWDAITARLSLGHLGGQRTALHGVSQILPGQLTASDMTTTSPISLWSATKVAKASRDLEQDVAAAQLRQAVIDCTQAWASCYEAILLRLSGGVDSAILLGGLSLAGAATKVTCLNYHSPGANSDERCFARLAASRAGVELVERERNAAFRLDDVLAVSRTPTPESYIGRMGSGKIDVEVADAHGTPTMFTGAGGDQIFFQFRCTWPAADYLRAHGLGFGFVRASLDAARLGRVSLWHSMLRALIDARHRSSPLDGAGQYGTLNRREALEGARHLDRYVHPELLCASELPIGKFRQVQELINPFGYYDSYLCEAAPELVRPLLSQPLVELCLALPTWSLAQGGRGRALARRAFANDIPREIVTRQSKGGMDEHVATVLRRNLPLARSLLLEGRLVAQGLLDRTKVEKALAGRVSTSGECLSEIHDYIAIEAWLRRVEPSPQQVSN
jgi:asparagine synthase (glutamine-hydrolysing)